MTITETIKEAVGLSNASSGREWFYLPSSNCLPAE